MTAKSLADFIGGFFGKLPSWRHYGEDQAVREILPILPPRLLKKRLLPKSIYTGGLTEKLTN